MTVKITVLSENIAATSYVLAEFGWSLLIEADGKKILLDTGPSISACHNADILGVDLSQIDKIVLSHSHFDHTGGLRDVLLKMRKKEVEVIAHPDIWKIRYNRYDKGDKFMGVPFQRQELENFGAKFNLTTQPVKITDTIMTFGEVPLVTEFEEKSVPAFGGSGRFIQEGTEFKTDTVLDDLGIVIKTDAGLVVILGCAHRGCINSIYRAQQLTGIQKIHAVIGGAHLISESVERIHQTIAALKELNIDKLGLCHCTGMPAVMMMAHEFGDKFLFCNAGTVHGLA
jgi:7,8-dihydropterin-6-yl-methyl-4-(beta-D-ribofuranosyl)aminobenzene 5'-phosphate synthase